MDTINIKIADDYTKIPGVREEIEGDFPGERFLHEILLPKFREALQLKKKLYIDLDGTAGYATSFLESAFGGLCREYKDPKIILENITLKSDDDPYLVDDIKEYIREANTK